MPKAAFHTFGCKLNFAETSSLAEMFRAEGIMIAGKQDVPDIIVVNTCSVTEEADKKCRQYVRSMHRRYPEAKIVITGCYAQLKPEEASSLPGVSLLVGNDRKDRVLHFLRHSDHGLVNVIPTKDFTSFASSCSKGDRTRYFLKVQDGCDCWCTYCTIPAARGKSRSGSIESIVEQARHAVELGAKEIVITGVNIGDFGKRTCDDSGLLYRGRENLLGLIQKLDAVEGIERYRISSIEPDLLTDEIVDFCANSRAFMPHFHVPLQSGSDAVLKLMHRRYDMDLFRHKMMLISERMPDAFIGIDLMVGCRGETSEEFERSKRFVESLPITRLHIFPYSERPGTKALEIPHSVSQQEKHRRVNEMMEVSERKMSDFASRFLGTVRPVLLEHSNRGGVMSGFTDNYIKVIVNGIGCQQLYDNRIVPVRLVEMLPNEMGDSRFIGELVME